MTRPYAPSWVNVVTEWLEGLPGPTRLAYAVAAAAWILAGSFAPGTSVWAIAPTDPAFGPALASTLYYGTLPAAVLGLMHLLDTRARNAVAALAPRLALDAEGVAELSYRLSVAPARPAAIVAILAPASTAIGYLLDPVGSGIVGYDAAAMAFRIVAEGLITALFVVLLLHTFRQLRLIAGVHRDIKDLNLFDQGPLYAMSGVTSTTAIGLLLLLGPSVLLIPAGANAAYIVLTGFWYGLAGVAAAAAFFLPLRGVHARLGAEKRRLRGEVGRRIAQTAEALNTAVDTGDGPAVDLRHRSLTALIAERDLIERAPTWPWSGSSITGLVSAILLPLVLFVIQRGIAAVLPA